MIQLIINQNDIYQVDNNIYFKFTYIDIKQDFETKSQYPVCSL